MVTDINRGIGMQLFANAISPENNQASFAYSYKSFDFNEHNDLVLTNDYTCYLPQYLVLNMFNWVNQFSDNDNLSTIYNLINNLNLTFNVGYRLILQFPIKLLWDLKMPTIKNNKLYIHIPFDMFFGKINIALLVNNDVHFNINEIFELHNYVRNYSMISQIIMNNQYTVNGSYSLQNSMVHPIQQLSSIHTNALSGVTTNAANNNMVNDFRIKTDVFQGRTRGLFISCNVGELIHLRFYINNILRDDYDEFFINHFCKKINDHLIYFPFNAASEYSVRNFGSADGALDFSCLDSSILHLQFSQPQQTVSVHNLYLNEFRSHYGLGGLLKNMLPRIAHINNSVEPIIAGVPTLDMLDLSGNIIGLHPRPTNLFMDLSGNNMQNVAISVTATETGFVNTGTVQLESDPVYPVNIHPIISREIGERNICNITHEEIGEGHRYMSCSSCENNYSEYAIVTWLQKKPQWLRTCPTCRHIWGSYCVYVNEPVE
jgi:hypothetical protein